MQVAQAGPAAPVLSWLIVREQLLFHGEFADFSRLGRYWPLTFGREKSASPFLSLPQSFLVEKKMSWNPRIASCASRPGIRIAFLPGSAATVSTPVRLRRTQTLDPAIASAGRPSIGLNKLKINEKWQLCC
ncbi:hypothetical protein [Arthrobacter sp. AL12]|uniref:hypothetical protein n=1 Tax=Arthrobacter sp. AL12 TaxID=3042241 RepID=UPI002499B42E|nr:hypothetical protein [Arthrobacter sp. AL12]MDI3212322.1 hypothetical protein [Arthrobacter sp. AL12]